MNKIITVGCVVLGGLGFAACASDPPGPPPPPPPPPPAIHEYVPSVVDTHMERHHHGHGHGMHHKPPVVIHEPPPPPPQHKTKWQKMKEWKSKHLHHNNSDGSSK